MMKTINKSTRLDFSYTSQIPFAVLEYENSFHKKYEDKTTLQRWWGSWIYVKSKWKFVFKSNMKIFFLTSIDFLFRKIACCSFRERVEQYLMYHHVYLMMTCENFVRFLRNLKNLGFEAVASILWQGLRF